MVEVLRLTFGDGKIAILVKAEPVDPVATETLRSEMRLYASWVQDRYPDRYDTMFHGPCCGSLIIELPDSIAQHVELMKEYFETTGIAAPAPVRSPQATQTGTHERTANQ